MKLTHFGCLYYEKRRKVPECLDEEGDFVLACFRTCQGNLWETKVILKGN